MSVLVLGIGNTIMSDDGFGVHLVNELQKRYRCSGEIEILDGGTLGLDLLPRLENIDRLLVVDALEMHAKPGKAFRLEGEEVPRAFASKLSVHQMGVQDLLAVAEMQGCLPGELVVWGVQPASLEMGTELTPVVSQAIDQVIRGIVGDLEAWGITLQKAA